MFIKSKLSHIVIVENGFIGKIKVSTEDRLLLMESKR